MLRLSVTCCLLTRISLVVDLGWPRLQCRDRLVSKLHPSAIGDIWWTFVTKVIFNWPKPIAWTVLVRICSSHLDHQCPQSTFLGYKRDHKIRIYDLVVSHIQNGGGISRILIKRRHRFSIFCRSSNSEAIKALWSVDDRPGSKNFIVWPKIDFLLRINQIKYPIKYSILDVWLELGPK